MRDWTIPEAHRGLEELIRRALAGTPQRVQVTPDDAVVVIHAADYERLTQPRDLVTFLRASPLADALADGELELDRPPDGERDGAL